LGLGEAGGGLVFGLERLLNIPRRRRRIKRYCRAARRSAPKDAGSEYWRMWEELDAEHFTVVDAAERMAAFAAPGLPPLYRTNRVQLRVTAQLEAPD
jgi:hypothetical protein